MLAPFAPTAMLWADCGRSTASPTESGSHAPALQSRITVHAKVKCCSVLQGSGPRRFRDQPADDGVDNGVRPCPYLLFGQWYDRVRYSHYFVGRNTQIGALDAGRLPKLRGRDVGRRNPLALKIGDIVRTARYARPSRA